MRIILSTRNPTKAEQIRDIFKGSSIEVVTLTDVGIDGESKEDGETLKDNALKKALFAYERSDDWTMADDTGVFIDSLNGLPGVRTSRWAGDNATTEETMAYTLKRLLGKNDRTAKFMTVVALVSPSGEEHFFTGEIRGKILDAPKTRPQPKMPYSPIFMPDGTGKVWAEMTVEEENAISHRGQAFRRAKAFLESLAEGQTASSA